MAGSYRVRYKKGDLEIEVESEDRAYVERIIDKLRSGTQQQPQNSPLQTSKAAESAAPKQKRSKPGGLDIAGIRRSVSESEAYPSIQTNILKTTNQLARVLLAFVAANDCGYKNLTTGDVARITAELGVRRTKTPPSHANLSRYLCADRKKRNPWRAS